VQLHDAIARFVDLMSAAFPFAPVQGLSNSSDYVHAMLYRVKPPAELNDAIIRATCERIEQGYPAARYAGMANGVTVPGRGFGDTTEAACISSRVAELVQPDGVTTVLVPVNFGNQHWCGVVVSTKAKSVCYYDSLNSRLYKTALDALASKIVAYALPGYTVKSINAPIQFDGFSCGFYVCTKFWRFVDKAVSNDMTPRSMLMRRFELVRFVRTGCKPDEIQSDESKPTHPPDTEVDSPETKTGNPHAINDAE
jgi:hypothetical protein